MLNLLKKLLSKFIKPAVIQRHKEKLSEVAFNDPENQLDAPKLFIGLVTRSEVRKKLEGGDITDHDVKKSYSCDCILCFSSYICIEVVSP